jgi:CheY-like chemotaxis protein
MTDDAARDDGRQGFSARLADVRHDLRTSVGHITGYSEMLLEDYEDDLSEPIMKKLQSLDDAGQRMLGMIDELLGAGKASLAELDLPECRDRLTAETTIIASNLDSLVAESESVDDDDFADDLDRMVMARGILDTRIQSDLIDASFEDVAEDDGESVSEGDDDDAEYADLAARFDTTGDILVVDDDAMNRHLLDRRLTGQGYVVHLAEGGAEALDYMADNPVDLVLLDLMMPGVDGLETLRRLKKDPILKHVPVLMLSAVDDVDRMAQCVAAGAEDYIGKPFNPVLLRTRIGTVLEKYRLRRQFAQNIRVFISSPGDVIPERVMTKNVITLLNEEFAGKVFMIPILWEEEPLVASDTFQAQIEQPSKADIYVGILWSRIGSELPESVLRDDGTRYESGTVFEFEEALRGFEDDGKPDILVYRKTATPTTPLDNREAVLERMDQVEKLDAYIEGQFRHPDGSYKSAFHNFETLDQFETMLRTHLGKLLVQILEQQSS